MFYWPKTIITWCIFKFKAWWIKCICQYNPYISIKSNKTLYHLNEMYQTTSVDPEFSIQSFDRLIVSLGTRLGTSGTEVVVFFYETRDTIPFNIPCLLTSLETRVFESENWFIFGITTLGLPIGCGKVQRNSSFPDLRLSN